MFCKKSIFVSISIAALLLSVIAFSPTVFIVNAQTTPALTILSPAGALNPSTVVRQDFEVSFTVSNFELVQPGIAGQTNNANQGHIHVFLDGAYIALWINSNPIPFNGMTPGNHTISLELVNNDHASFSPKITQNITVSITTAPIPLGTPGISILGPAGSLNTNSNVPPTFALSFTLKDFVLGEPVGQPNAINTGHIHVFIDGTYDVLWVSEAPIPIYDLSTGQHTVKLELVNNDHSSLSPAVSATTTVNVQAPAASTSVDLKPVENGIANLMYIAIVIIVLAIIAIILAAVAAARAGKRS